MPSKRSSQNTSAVQGCMCRICGKSIQNEASIQRHERYCRKRISCPAPPRRKSCAACIRAKSRCDSLIPACGTCQRKGKSCVYTSGSLSPRKEQSISSTGRCSPEQQVLNAPITMSFTHHEAAESTSSSSMVMGSSSDLSVQSSQSYSPASETARRDVLGGTDMIFTLRPSEIPSPSYSRLLRPKERQPARPELMSKLVSQIICSYAERRMDEDSCPAFIHHSIFQRSAKSISSEDPITICQCIMREFGSRQDRGDSTVWDAITSEQERIYDQRDSFDRWFLLSSAQSLTIYLLMLAIGGESVLTLHHDIPITLLFTLGTLFKQLNEIHSNMICAKELSKDSLTWEDWIFVESKSRTATVYFIFALHFDVEFGLPCDRQSDYEFEDVDLPAAKLLWEAKSEPAWRRAMDLIERAGDHPGPTRLPETRLKYGDLIRVNKQRCGYEYPKDQEDGVILADRIDRWQKEMDEFGMLVAMCSTMV